MNEIETLEEKIQRVKNEVIRITGLDVRFIKNKKDYGNLITMDKLQ